MNKLNYMLQNNKSNKIVIYFFVIFAVYILVNIAISSFLFVSWEYPDGYSWTELYINYEGGIIRRGLLGQLLFYCSHIVGVKSAVFIIFFPLYILFIYYSVKFFYKNLDLVTFIFVVSSPGLMFFFTQDRWMLCRKDVFFELGFIIQFTLLLSKKINTLLLFLLMLLIYIVCFLIHEATVFYAVLPFAVFLERAYTEKKFFIYFLSLCFVVCFSVWFLISFQGTAPQRVAIINAWSKFFHLSTDGALQFIGKSMPTKLNEEKTFYTASAWGYFIVGFMLTAFPVFYYAFKNNIIFRIKRLFLCKLNIFMVAVGLTLPWILPFIAVDFGRHIHTGCYYMLSFLACVVALTGGIEKKTNFHIKSNYMLWIFIFVNTFGWKLWHYAGSTHILSFSFPIRLLQIGWILSVDPS